MRDISKNLFSWGRRPQTTRGLNLLEIAVVLCIVGLIAGAVWVAGSRVRLTSQVRTTNQQLTSMAQNVRAVFAEQGGVIGAATTLTPALDHLRAFPLDMRQTQTTPAGIVFNIWSSAVSGGLGTVQIASDTCAGPGSVPSPTAPQPCFNVSFLNIPQGVCIQLLAATSQTGLGLQGVYVNGNMAGDANTSATPLPVTVATATANCTGTTNTIVWVYLLKDNKS